MAFKKFGLWLIAVLLLTSCGSSKRVSSTRNPQKSIPRNVSVKPAETSSETDRRLATSSGDAVMNYIDTYSPLAMQEMRDYKIPASITMAQAVLESGAGRGSLTTKANNHFGIKCHGWTGESVSHDDDAKGECFRKYKDPKYSFRDHSLFLTGRSRYASLFDLKPDDYKGWARGLKKAGYATDRKYPDKLISLIERYRLYLLDSEVLGTKPDTQALKNSDQVVSLHTVAKGDTLYNIAKRYDLTVEQLKKKNKLDGNIISIGQQLDVSPEYNGF
ncbi:MAG: glucosaminidase domain-containing protein [Leeuwenhoekiella sp.]